MRLISAILLLLVSTAQFAPAQYVRFIAGEITWRGSTLPRSVPWSSILPYYAAPPEVLESHGVYPAQFAQAQEGYIILSTTWAVINGTLLETITAQEPRPEPVPDLFVNGLEAPFVVLQSESEGKGYALIALDNGDTLTVLFHESPYPPHEEIRARIEARIAQHHRSRTERLNAADQFRQGQPLQRIEAIEAWILTYEGINE